MKAFAMNAVELDVCSLSEAIAAFRISVALSMLDWLMGGPSFGKVLPLSSAQTGGPR